MAEKIFIKSIADKFKSTPEDVLLRIAHLAKENIIRSIIPNVTLSNDLYSKEFDALEDLPISEAIVLSIATYGKWEGSGIKVQHAETRPQVRSFRFPQKSEVPQQTSHKGDISGDDLRVVNSQATFQEKISITYSNLFVYENDFILVEQALLNDAKQEASIQLKKQPSVQDAVPDSSITLQPSPADFSPLPPVKKRVSTEKGEKEKVQVYNTCRDNPEAAAYVKARREQGIKSEQIAGELSAAGASDGVIGCLLDPTKPNVKTAREHGKYLLKKAKQL